MGHNHKRTNYGEKNGKDKALIHAEAKAVGKQRGQGRVRREVNQRYIHGIERSLKEKAVANHSEICGSACESFTS